MKIPGTRYSRDTTVSLGSTKNSPKGQRSIPKKAAATWRTCCSVVGDGASSGSVAHRHTVTDTPFPILYSSNSRRPSDHRSTNRAANVLLFSGTPVRGTRRVRGNTIMSPGVPVSPSETRYLRPVKRSYPTRNYERPKTSAVSRRRATGPFFYYMESR